MATITKEVEKRLDSLTDAAHSGQLGSELSTFVLRTVSAVYAAPGNFSSEGDMFRHLKTLTYLIDLHVYRP